MCQVNSLLKKKNKGMVILSSSRQFNKAQHGHHDHHVQTWRYFLSTSDANEIMSVCVEGKIFHLMLVIGWWVVDVGFFGGWNWLVSLFSDFTFIRFWLDGAKMKKLKSILLYAEGKIWQIWSQNPTKGEIFDFILIMVCWLFNGIGGPLGMSDSSLPLHNAVEISSLFYFSNF